MPCGLNVYRLILNVNNELFLTAGVDLKLYESNLKSVYELNRTNKENSIRLMIKIRNDRIVAASNFDIEIYTIVGNSIQKSLTNGKSLESVSSQINESGLRIRELKRYLNAHKDTILTLENISGM